MAPTGLKTVSLACLLMLAACGSMSGDWPNLSDPLPDASERERVLERLQPVLPSAKPTREAAEPITKESAARIVAEAKTQITEAKTLYLKAKKSLAVATGEEKEVIWHEAQLLLTRFSYTSNQLDSVLYSDVATSERVWQQAQELKLKTDEYAAAERQFLIQLKP